MNRIDSLVAELKKEYASIGKKIKLSNNDRVYKHALTLIDDRRVEYFIVYFLTSQNTIIKYTIEKGIEDACYVYPKKIIRGALDVGSPAIILVHNHPSGEMAPSENDRRLTFNIIFAAQITQIEVLDHIIIGGGESYSMRKYGLIEDYKRKVKTCIEKSFNSRVP